MKICFLALLILLASCGSDKNSGSTAPGIAPFTHAPLVGATSITPEEALQELRNNHFDDFHRLYKGQSWKKDTRLSMRLEIPEIAFNESCTFVTTTTNTVTDFNQTIVKILEVQSITVLEAACKKIMPEDKEEKIIAVYKYDDIFSIDGDLSGLNQASFTILKGMLNGAPHLSLVGSVKDEEGMTGQFSALVNMNYSALYNITSISARMMVEGSPASMTQTNTVLNDVDVTSLSLAGISEVTKDEYSE